MEVLGLAHRYGFVELESSISDYLKAVLNIRNVCLIFDIASMYNLKSLCVTCCEFMDRNASDIIQSENFFTLSTVCMICIFITFCRKNSNVYVSFTFSTNKIFKLISSSTNCHFTYTVLSKLKKVAHHLHSSQTSIRSYSI